jgi:ketosteroid isomerase-like protein
VDMDERTAVLEANQAFYRAFESLDLTRMESVWLHAASITCVHPGWRVLRGWGLVMASWQRIFANTVTLRLGITDAQVEVVGDLAWVVCTENLDSTHRGETVSAQLLATNLFQRHEGRWWLVHHHVSPVSAQSPDVAPERMH